MRKELIPVLLAAALVGSACQRPPEATRPPPTPISASGEPRPSGIEAEIQRRVQATVTTQQETTFKTTQPELELFEASSFEFKYPKGWIKEEKSHLPISFIDPKSAKDNSTKITFFISGNPFGSSADIDTLLEDIERREGMSLSRSNYKGPPPKAKQIPPVDRKPAYRISVERVPDPEGKPEYDLNTFIIFSAEEIVYFNLFTDPSVTDKVKPLFETVVRTFKERPVQRVETPRQERQKSPEEQILEQAKQTTLEAWFDLLSTTQQIDVGNTKLKIDFLNKELWKTFVGNLVRTNRHPADIPADIRWSATSFRTYPMFQKVKNSISGYKYSGKLQINNIALQASSQTLSSADRANGLAWNGSVAINFIQRYRATYAEMERNIREEKEFMKWLDSPETDFPLFSQWKEDGWRLNLRLRNGRWEKDFKKREGRLEGPAMLNGMILPVDALSYLDPPRCKGNCKTIKVATP